MTESQNKKDLRLLNGSLVLQRLFENGKSPLSQQFIRWKLWKKWPDFVGPTIGKVCEPVGYRNGTLFVWVSSASWMQQLVFGLDQMKNQINSKIGYDYVKMIHLTMNRRAVPCSEEDQEQLRNNIGSLMSQGDD